jgi:hypothetical protein
MLEPLPPSYQWVQYERVDDAFWSSLRSVLVNFVAFRKSGKPEQLGTGFVIDVLADGYLVVLTAKHVVERGNIQVTRKGPVRAPNAPSILFEAEEPDISPEAMVAVWMGSATGDILQVKYLHYSAHFDLAVCMVQLQEHLRPSGHLLVPTMALDVSLPQVGEDILLAALGGLKAEKTSNTKGQLGTYRFTSSPVVRRGKVTSIEERSMDHKAHAFTTTIPVPGGMSGGFAYRVRADNSIGACGIISSSPSGDEYITSFEQAGGSTVVGIMAALGFTLPTAPSKDAEKLPLLDYIHEGHISEVSGRARWLRWRATEDEPGVEIYPSPISI